MPDAPVTVTFEGLMVFRKERTDLINVGIMVTKNMSSVGLPGIPDHVSKITVTPDPASGTGSLEIDERRIAAFLAMGNVWNLDVVTPSGIRTGIDRLGAPTVINRHNPDPSQHDFAWLMNLNELHGTLPLRYGQIKPIISMTNGTLTTVYKTDGIDLLRGPVSSPSVVHFGFIGEAAGLEVNLRPSEALVLRVGSSTVFRIDYNPAIHYQVAIENVMHHVHTPMPNAVDHFQAYYGLLFPSISDRFRLQLTNPPEHSPNPPPQTSPADHNQLLTIDPFKCGGITLEDGGPLG